MFGRIWARLRPAVLWSCRRGSWQYDIIVALILAFVFLSPQDAFNDRPSSPVVHEIDAREDGVRIFWIESRGLRGSAPAEPLLQELLQRQAGGEDLHILRVESTADGGGNLRAYIVYARP